MQISAKARLVSIIVAVVFMFGALAGTGAYLIVNHINGNAITSSNFTSIGNMIKSGDNDFIDNATYQALMTKLGNNTTSTRKKSAINGGTPIVFQMGTVPGTSTPIYWEVVYQTGDTITVWMTQPYTKEYFNNNGVTVSNGVFSGATQTDYDYENGYSRSTLRQATQRIYSDLNAAYPVFSKVVKSPSNAGVSSWQSSQGNAKYNSSYWSITNGLGTNSNSGSASSSDINDRNPYNWSWSSCMSDMFWIPSHYEVCNTSTSGSGSSTNGLWGLSTTDSAFTTTTLKGSVSVSYCWLRSGFSSGNSAALLVNSSGSADYDSVSSSRGVRPAAHLSLSALQKAATTITLTENIYTTGGEINPDAVTTLLETVQYFGHENDTATYTAHQIASRNNTAGYNSDRTIVFPMGYYVDPNGNMDTSKPLMWQAVYLRNGYLTIWMTQPYTNGYYNYNGRTVNAFDPGNDHSGSSNSGYYSNYSMSQLRDITKNIYTLLSNKFTTLNTVITAPSTAASAWQTTQSDVYTYSSSYYDHHNGLGSYSGSYTWGSGTGTVWSSCMSDRFWIPSSYEIFNTNTSSSSNSTTNGLWGLTAADNGFSTTTLDRSSTTYCWLRSGNSLGSDRAMLVNSSGSAYYTYVYDSYGVRPAAHLDLDALYRTILPAITITTNNSEYGQVFADGQIGESVTVNAATGEQVSNLIAVPNAGYAFLYWENASTHEIFSELNPLSFTVTGDITLTAVFGKSVEGVAVSIAYQNTDGTITTNQDNIPLAATGEARITGYTTLNGIDYVHFSAVAYTGYYFVGWQVDGEILIDSTTNQNYLASANIPYNLIQDKQVFAVFALIPNQNNINNETDNGYTDDFNI